MNKILVIMLLILASISVASADFSAKITKQVDIRNETEVEARVSSAKAMIRGVLEVNPVDKNQYLIANEDKKEEKEEKKEGTRVRITWTDLVKPDDTISLEGLTSELTLKKAFIRSGRTVLVKGNTPDDLKIKDDKDKKDKENARNSTGSTGGSTSITTGASDPISPDNSNSGAMDKPDYVTTFDGCTQVYDQSKETIRAYQRIYYVDNKGKEIEVQPCTLIKEYPANKKECETKLDYEKHIAYKMYQPYFVAGDKDNQQEYGAGGCIVAQQLMMMLDYDKCPAKAMGDKFIKQGKWYYQNDDASKTYVTDCVIDPTGNEKQLQIEFQGCEVTHDIANNTSKYLGKYYWVKEDNTKEYLSDCVETNKSYFNHQLRWNKDQWKHFVDDWYSERVFTRYITVPDVGEVIIADDELEGIKYKQYDTTTWVYHDELSHSRQAEGYSTKTVRRYVKFGTQEYYAGQETTEDVKSVYVSSRVTDRKSCKHSTGHRFYYKDKMKRGDGTTYETSEYDTGC